MEDKFFSGGDPVIAGAIWQWVACLPSCCSCREGRNETVRNVKRSQKYHKGMGDNLAVSKYIIPYKDGLIIPNHNVLVEVKQFDRSSEIPEGYQGAVYEGQGKLLMPGFVNSHSLPYDIDARYGENMVLSKWLNDCIFPLKRDYNPMMYIMRLYLVC
jgi:hypothetical protein